MVKDAVLAVLGVVLLVGFRWLVAIQRRVDDLRERVAYLEAKTNGRDHH